jgi:voltage-gated potassium channel
MLLFSKIFAKLISMNNRFLLLASSLLIAISSVLIYYLEPDTYGNVFNGFWWVMTTVTTVGYGDFYPHTVAGKILAIFLYIFGISLIGVVISKVVDSFYIYKKHREEGKLKFKGENHFVIIDWSKNAELAIQEILKSDPSITVVLIDRLEKTPIFHERVHYIQGNPAHRETLEKANLSRAKAVFIFANELSENNQYIHDTSLIDGKTLLIATAVERNYSHIYTVVEIMEKENIDHFLHVKVNEFILADETVSKLAVRSAFSPGTSKIFSQLLTRQDGEDLYEVRKRGHWTTYRDAFEDLLKEGATLISNGEHLNINRRLHEPIPDNARLFVICDQETYVKIAQKSS